MNTHNVDNSDENRDITTNRSSAAYAYVDCTPLDETNALGKQWEENREKTMENNFGPEDGAFYFRLEKDETKRDAEMDNNERHEAYGRLDRTSKLTDCLHQDGDDGAYQHIELQATPHSITCQ